MHFAGQWKDIGTWNALMEAMEDSVIGEGILNDVCENTHVVNKLDILVLCMGLKNVVVSVSPDGMLVFDKEQSSYIKPYVDAFEQEIMYAEKSWGSYWVLDVGEGSMTVKVLLMPGFRMNYHSHAHRDEAWKVVSGMGRTVEDGMEQPVKASDVITVQAYDYCRI